MSVPAVFWGGPFDGGEARLDEAHPFFRIPIAGQPLVIAFYRREGRLNGVGPWVYRYVDKSTGAG